MFIGGKCTICDVEGGVPCKIEPHQLLLKKGMRFDIDNTREISKDLLAALDLPLMRFNNGKAVVPTEVPIDQK